jgi:hypothetical protein
MKKLKIKNIAVVSAFVAGNLFALNANSVTLYSGTPGNFAAGPNVITNISLLPSGSTVDYTITAYVTNPNLGQANPYNGALSIYATTSTTSSRVGTSGSLTFGTSAVTLTGSFVTTADGLMLAWGGNGSIGVGGTTWTLTNLVVTSGAVSSSSVDLVPNAYALRSVYNIQSAAINAGLSYDCAVFDKEGLCLSTGGRYSTTNSPEASTTSGLLIGSYKYDKNVRLGAWIDQNLSTQNADGIKLSNNEPLFGVFGVWAERNDGLGYEVKVSAGYGDKDVTVTRTSTNEGSSKINSRGLQSVSSFGVAIDKDWIAAPYLGLKYVSLKRGSYAEGGSSALTYDALRQESTSVVAGVKFTGKIDPKTFAVLSAGVEQDLSNNVGQYSAGSSNTTAFNSNVQKTRPVVTAGVYYDIDKTQRFGLNATHRQEAFQSTVTTSALATYTVGF